MLWTDGDFITAAELATLDSDIVEVASAEGMALDGASGVIHRAIEEAGEQMLRYAREFGAGYVGSSGITGNHIAAVLSIGSVAIVRPKVLLSQVVVSGLVTDYWAPVKRWVCYWALMLFFRDAHTRTLTDRYATKASNYRDLARGQYWQSLMDRGLPMVDRPLPCPGALFEPDTGTWDEANVSAVAGSGTVEGDYDVVVAWKDASQPVNSVSGPSERVTMTLAEDQVLAVDITSLNPPTGAQNAAQAAVRSLTPLAATHWRMYAGVAGGKLYAQGDWLPVATKTLTLSADPATSGEQPTQGQHPDRYLMLTTTLDRG